MTVAVPTIYAIDPKPSRRVGLNAITLATHAREDGGREVAWKRYADSTRRSLRCADLQVEDGPIRRPLRREAAQRRREASVDLRQVADLRHDSPRSTTCNPKLDASNVRLRESLGQQRYRDSATALTVK